VHCDEQAWLDRNCIQHLLANLSLMISPYDTELTSYSLHTQYNCRLQRYTRNINHRNISIAVELPHTVVTSSHPAQQQRCQQYVVVSLVEGSQLALSKSVAAVGTPDCVYAYTSQMQCFEVHDSVQSAASCL
jgi:hypothetical protein